MNLPDALLNSLKGIEGFDYEAFTAVHQRAQPPVSVRLNPRKPLHTLPFPGVTRVPWSAYGYYIEERPSFTLDPRLHAGAYYVQEASSMFLEQALRQHAGLDKSLRVLDLCAAPGGKSTLLQAVLSDDSLLVSNDVLKSRTAILEENLTKWGVLNTVVTNNDPRDFSALPAFFDVMVVDAPCSGSGLFRRDPQLTAEWSPQTVQLCSQRQQRILSDAYPALAAEGLLIYSTCSYSREENESITEWLLTNFELEPLRIETDPAWNIIETSTTSGGFGYRFFPDKIAGEGFYLSCFRKKDGDKGTAGKNKKRSSAVVKSVPAQTLHPFAASVPEIVFIPFGDRILAVHETVQQILPRLQETLYLRKAGAAAGKLSPKGLIPDHELALSGLIGNEVVDIALNLEDALQYLRKEAVSLNEAKAGWATVSYDGLRLGWVKVLSGRMNNYYPQAWRILKSSVN